MSSSQNQSSLNFTRGVGPSFGPNDGVSSYKATPGMSVGSATAAGHGDHPNDYADESGVRMPSTRVGPPNEDLEGEQMRTPGEGDVMDTQVNKKNAGWGEEGSYTSDLDRQKAEQNGAREEIKEARRGGESIDSGAGRKAENEGLGSV